MNRNKNWQKFEDYICEQLKSLDKTCHITKASGGSTIKGDVTNNLGLHIECKQRKIKSVFNQNWYDKCQSEIPLHSNKIAILITENIDKKRMIHLSFEDFYKLFKELYLHKND